MTGKQTSDVFEPGLHGWQLESQPKGDQGLEIILTGRWCLDQALPSWEVLRPELDRHDLRRLCFRADQLDAWDTGLLAFLTGVLKFSAWHEIAADCNGLPAGVQHLIKKAFAAPDQMIAVRRPSTTGILSRLGAQRSIFAVAFRKCWLSSARSPCPWADC